MKRIVLIAFFALLLFPITSGFSQEKVDKPSVFGIGLTSFTPHQFKDDQGYTVIIGEVQNLKNFPVTDVKVWGGFYSELSEQPIESAIGTTVIDVIPPFGKSPYVIKSTSPDAGITNVSVNLLGFTSAAPKNDDLVIESEASEIGDNIKISGTVTNNGPGGSSDTKVHVAFYDAFEPPRILGVATIEILVPIDSGSSYDFEFNEKFDSRALGYKLMAESSSSYSNVQNVQIVRTEGLTKLVTIKNISIHDDEGNKLADIAAGKPINIQSEIAIEFSEGQASAEQPFRYFAQVKESETGKVEFIGIYDTTLDPSGSQYPAVEWVPPRSGFFFIETFVWDENDVPLASKGPLTLLLVT